MKEMIRVTIFGEEIAITVYNSAQAGWVIKCIERVGLNYIVDKIDGEKKITYIPETDNKADLFDLMYELADNEFDIELF